LRPYGVRVLQSTFTTLARTSLETGVLKVLQAQTQEGT
jgi:hypothetical protein